MSDIDLLPVYTATMEPAARVERRPDAPLDRHRSLMESVALA